MFKFLCYKVGQFIVSRLSLPAAYRFAMILSDIQYYCSFRDRRAVTRNLRKICPDATDIHRLAREVFRNFGKYLVEFFRMAGEIDQDFIRERVTVPRLDYIEQALARGRGVIFLTAHIGNWELGGVVMSLLGYPPVAIALPHKERPVNNLFNRQREARGVTIVPTYSATRRCLGLLRQNKMVAVVADRLFGGHGVVLDFLGEQAEFPRGPAIFALKTGAAIVPLFLTRTGGDRFELTVSAPIYPPEDSGHGRPDDERLTGMMRQYIKVIEEQIRRHPEQWLMFRDYGRHSARGDQRPARKGGPES